MTRTAARLASALAAAASVIAPLAPAAAQTDPERTDGPASLTLNVDGFTGVLHGDDVFELRATVTNDGRRAIDGVRLLGTLHHAETRRFDLQRAIDDGEVGPLWESFSAEVEAIPAGASRSVRVTRTAAELGFRQVAGNYGVYPLQLALQRDRETVAEVRTALVVSPAEVTEPVRASLVVPIDGLPARRADGSFTGDRLLRELAPGGRLPGLVASVGDDPVPVTVATSGMLLEQVAVIAGGAAVVTRDGASVALPPDGPAAAAAARFLERLGELLEREEVDHLALSYGPADLVALVRGGAPSEAVRLITEGQAVSERLTGARPLPSVLWPADGLDGPTLVEALGAQVDTVLLGEQHLQVPTPHYSPSPVRRLRAPAGPTLTTLVPDPWLEEVLQRDHADQGAAIAAQRVLAETAALYFEQPAIGDRGVLITPPQLWDPPRGMLRSLTDGLRGAPWLQPVTLSDLAAQVDGSEGGAVQLAYPRNARASELPPSYVADLREARRALGSLAGVLAVDDETPGRFDRLLLAAASVHYRGPLQARGWELVRTVGTTVSDIYGAVSVNDGPVVTLAGAEGRVPITLTNEAAVPLHVQVRLLSQRYDFDPPVLRGVHLEAGDVHTVAVDTTAISPGGISGIRVVVEDPDGLQQLAEGTVVVRSTGFNVVALAITVAAGLFLLGWGVRDAARRRRIDEHEATERDAAAA